MLILMVGEGDKHTLNGKQRRKNCGKLESFGKEEGTPTLLPGPLP